MSAKGPNTSPPQSPAAAKITRGHSCVLCAQKKIKCTGQKPCAACIKARVECVTKPSVPAQRRKAKFAVAKEDILTRLRRCEEQLRRRSEKDGDGSGSESPERGRDNVAAGKQDELSSGEMPFSKLVVTDRSRRFVNNHLLNGLLNELDDTKEILDELEAEDDKPGHVKPEATFQADFLIFGQPGLHSLRSSHPQPVQIFKLWQTCLDNVNPMVKLFHAPTVQQMVLEASGNLDSIPTSSEALMFAIYLSAAVSISEEECRTIMGESKTTTVLKFSNAAQQALVNAKFLRSSNLVVVQAFALFLLAIWPNFDFQTFWALTGLAIRCGERIGLHRDSVNDSLSPFEGEIRRRLWRQILMLDGRASQLVGASSSALVYFTGDMKRPLNVNDSDLNPSMKELPPEHVGATEMLFCSLRYEIGEYMYKSGAFITDGRTHPDVHIPKSLAEKDHSLNAFASRLEDKFLKYCDTSIPFHRFVSTTARVVIDHGRLNTHHPRQYHDRGASLPQEEKDMLLAHAMRVIEYHNMCNADKSLRGFLWHINVFFPFEALILLLSDLCQRTHGELVLDAWRVVDQVYDYHPEMMNDTKNAVYLAIGNLAIKAFRICVSHEASSAALWQSASVQVISNLCSRRKIRVKDMALRQSMENNNTGLNDQNAMVLSTQSFDQHASRPFGDAFGGADLSTPSEYSILPDIDPSDWDYWQTLLNNQDLPMLDSEQSHILFQN